MTGRELEEKLCYAGMVRGARKLALKDELAKAEEIAVMTTEEVCKLIAKKYEVIYSEREEIGLMEKEKFEEFKVDLKVIRR